MNLLSLYLIIIINRGNPVTLHSFKKGYEGDPLSPPEGEAAYGEHLLAPSLSFSRSKRESLVNLQRAIAFFMDASAGRS